MIGAIIGDIVGSRFEWDNHRSKEFDLLCDKCSFTDDSVMSLAVCEALMRSKQEAGAENKSKFNNLEEQAVTCMQEVGRPYPHCGYGGRFRQWLYSDTPEPYNSFGNGSAMRVSACGYAANSIDEAIELADAVTKVTHNHPEGLKGARATAVAVFLARKGKSMGIMKQYILENFYNLNFTIDEIRSTYKFNESCQETVPQALQAFFESIDFEDAIRNAISVGGDSDTIAAITGSIAEAFYGVPNDIRKEAEGFLDDKLSGILQRFEKLYPAKVE